MDRAKIVAGLILAVLCALGPAGCSGQRRLRVASKNFTEQVILGEIVAQQLERRLGARIDRKLNLGGTLLAHQALIAGQIDLYPEYTGTALTAVLKMPPASDPAVVLERVRGEYKSRWGIEWLEPLGFNNTFAIVIHGEESRRSGIRTLSEAARRSSPWTMGAGYEFQQRPDGLDGLVKTYGLALRGTPKSMDLGLLYRAIGQRQVDMVAANATDGMLSVMDLAVLRDDQGYFPPYQAAVAVRGEALQAWPGLREALGELAGRFTDRDMQKLNYQVDGQHRPVAEVAAEFLRQMEAGTGKR